MAIPSTGFCLRIVRDRVERSGTGSGVRYRTVGAYSCYFDGALIDDAMLRGATVEPNGPGNNKTQGKNLGSRIEAGSYRFGSHAGTKYASTGYRNASPPRPGLYVFDTNVRSAILIHRGVGFKASVGCINLTGSISGPTDLISADTSYARMDYLIGYLKANVAGWPATAPTHIPGARLVIEGEP